MIIEKKLPGWYIAQYNGRVAYGVDHYSALRNWLRNFA